MTRTSNFQTKQESCILKRSDGDYITIQIKAFLATFFLNPLKLIIYLSLEGINKWVMGKEIPEGGGGDIFSFCFCCVMSQSIIVREGNFVLIFNLVKNTKIKKSLNVFGVGVEIELLVKPRQYLTEFKGD